MSLYTNVKGFFTKTEGFSAELFVKSRQPTARSLPAVPFCTKKNAPKPLPSPAGRKKDCVFFDFLGGLHLLESCDIIVLLNKNKQENIRKKVILGGKNHDSSVL